MKNLMILTVIFLMSVACQEENLPVSEEVVGEWKLIQSHHYVGTEVIRNGDNLEWQETYTFRPNGAFQKTRITAAGPTTASGTFVTEDAPLYLSRPVRLLVKLTFNSDAALSGGCSPGTEELDLSSHDGFLRNYAVGCEKPILTYNRN